MTKLQKAAVVADKLLGVLHCPNCSSPIRGHPDNACVLNALMESIEDRGDKTHEELDQLHAKCDVHALWDDLGKVIDKLEDGGYSSDE